MIVVPMPGRQLLVDPHLEVRCDTKQVPIEGSMVDLAQAEAVLRHRLAEFVGVAHDVRGIQQVSDRQRADSALRGIGVDDPPTEFWLVQPLLHHPLGVASLGRAGVERVF
ncbi:MAG TPA: hypothetical protein VK053_19830 [Jiangellaceae bacterium]|nr:hypothetical protein [Jiangellaceae bacterium]